MLVQVEFMKVPRCRTVDRGNSLWHGITSSGYIQAILRLSSPASPFWLCCGWYRWHIVALPGSSTRSYMNCAPIVVSGVTNSTVVFDTLPDMIVAKFFHTAQGFWEPCEQHNEQRPLEQIETIANWCNLRSKPSYPWRDVSNTNLTCVKVASAPRHCRSAITCSRTYFPHKADMDVNSIKAT
jgi:hypothetical protein